MPQREGTLSPVDGGLVEGVGRTRLAEVEVEGLEVTLEEGPRVYRVWGVGAPSRPGHYHNLRTGSSSRGTQSETHEDWG